MNYDFVQAQGIAGGKGGVGTGGLPVDVTEQRKGKALLLFELGVLRGRVFRCPENGVPLSLVLWAELRESPALWHNEWRASVGSTHIWRL